ncbi:MAG: hypothetical protein QXI11_03875 [Thermoproteota archaeon]
MRSSRRCLEKSKGLESKSTWSESLQTEAVGRRVRVEGVVEG